jgi:predicted RND superfamily exporter protein
MLAALAACFGTFLVRAALGMGTDILMPNLWTIAFVLTLSHIVYLTAEWQRRSQDVGPEAAAREAVRLTGPASAWSLAANLLGFVSLIFVSAQPLRHFGISGAIAAALAILAAYVLFPPFLRAARQPRPRQHTSRFERFVQRRHPWIAGVTVAGAIVLAPLAWSLDTDPELPTYFGSSDPIHVGLEAMDRAGGTSPLDIVITDRANRSFADDDMVDRLQQLERRLENHPDVGGVLSIASLMGEAERPWYAFLFSWKTRLNQLESVEQGGIGRTFVSDDRRRGRFILRMRETTRSRPRSDVISEIEAAIADHGFRSVLVGGLYPLQGELSSLVQGSVVRGLGGLIVAFALMALAVTRSWQTALVMGLCLAVTPLLLFGAVAIWRMPVDIISAPAANVALPLGVDEMIHVGYAVRRRRRDGVGESLAWQQSIGGLARPIVFSMVVVASGFALFLLSSFPPTQRLGILVCAGALLTDLVVLLVLPALATGGWRRKR